MKRDNIMQGSTKAAGKMKKIGGSVSGTTKPNASGTNTKFSIGVQKDTSKLAHKNIKAKALSGPQGLATAKYHATRGGSSMKKKLGGRY